MNPDTTNREMCNAYEMAMKTRRSFFLTGRAGTGKTTFLKAIQEEKSKSMIVLAPTGVAAINAGGQTIHSFFGLGFGVLGPGEIGTLNSIKISVVNCIDTIIIDEVSMVRCDIMDCIDRTLRHYRHSSFPFGGIQMIFVGDMFQLEPIAKPEDRAIIKAIYGKEECYFYNSRVIQSLNLPKIEFLKIYRQNDESFITLLEHFRTGRVTYSDLSLVNTRVVGHATNNEDYKITLTSYVRDAELLNESKLASLPGELYTFEAEYEGIITSGRDVAESLLRLKKGAQVMFTKNDQNKRWVNGTIAIVTSISEEGIVVSKENGEQIVLERETWDICEYVYDSSIKCCKKAVIGRVTQYPVRLAWAITIHKSQSLTFDHVAIDFGWGAFSNGQAYVALSRARSLEGIDLVRPVTYRSVKVSQNVLQFSTTYNDRQQIELELNAGEAENEYIARKDNDGAAIKLFEMSREEAANGRIAFAYELLNRAMSFVIDDSCLRGISWTEIPNVGIESVLLNAAGLFYSGNPVLAANLIAQYETQLEGNFTAYFIKARACESHGDMAGFYRAYYQMMEVFRSSIDNGIDSPAFKKYRYMMVTKGFDYYGEDAYPIILRLIKENPEYDSLYVALRHIVKANLTAHHNVDDMVSNRLVSMLYDDSVQTEVFVDAIREERNGRSLVWNGFMSQITKLK